MDIRDFLIGFLVAGVMLLLIGSTQNISSEIKTNRLQIVNDDGKVVAQVSSKTNGCEFIMYDSSGSIRVYSSTIGLGGLISIANDKGSYVASIGVDSNRDGFFVLMDRYGDVGLTLTGKR